MDVCQYKACAPEHRHRQQRGCSPYPLPEPGMETGILGTFSCWLQSFRKISGHILLRWVISVLLFFFFFTLPAVESQPWCLFPLPQGRFVPEWEVEGIWSLCFFHALWKLKFVERIGLLVPGRETRVSEDPRMRGKKILLRQGWDQRSIGPSRRNLSAVPYQCLKWLHGWSTKADIQLWDKLSCLN